MQKYDEAISCYNKSKEMFPASLQAGLAEEMIKGAEERKNICLQVEKIKKDISLSKETPRTYYDLGNKYLILLDFNSAIKAYNNAIDKSYGPIVLRARFNGGWCYKIQEDYENALRLFRSVSYSGNKELTPVNNYQMSLIYAKRGEVEKAGELVKDDEYPEVYKKLIEKYFKSIEKNK
jgi:tetratricopeptide (TPR) repeat protein